MIPASATSTQTAPHAAAAVRAVAPWQRELAEAIDDPQELLAALDLDGALAAPARAAGATFRLRVPRRFVALMRRGDPDDPLLRQVLPLGAELLETAGFSGDPLAEAQALRAPGLLQKYHGRALLVLTGACAVHCRYCFRREFPYAAQQGEGGRWDAALREIDADTSIEEVILSGGDPLSVSDARLATLLERLAALPHVRRLRIHTRLPVVLPSRVDAPLVRCLAQAARARALTVVLHANHPREIDGEVAGACVRLRAAGALLLNQSVLLRGVNDAVGTLAALSERLLEAGVLPYYLHLLDPVRGTAHFEVDEAAARRLVAQLAARLPGYLVPRLVREVAGAPAKVPVAPAPADTTVQV